MKAQNLIPTSNDSAFLYGAVLFANLDYSSLLDYAIKAVIGGAIWMVFKIGSEFIAAKISKHKHPTRHIPANKRERGDKC